MKQNKFTASELAWIEELVTPALNFTRTSTNELMEFTNTQKYGSTARHEAWTLLSVFLSELKILADIRYKVRLLLRR